MPPVSIVVPVFNEQANLQRFHDAVSEVMQSIGGYDWEFVFVDDGSRDRHGRVEVLRAHDRR